MTARPTPPPVVPRTGEARDNDLRAMLRDREREMRDVLQQRIRHVPCCRPGEGLDDTDHAEAEIQGHLEVTLIQLKGDSLRRVREALVRLDAGEYGYCVDCESEIPAPRLRAMPFAVRCTICERLHEQYAARERRSGTSQPFPFMVAGRAGP